MKSYQLFLLCLSVLAPQVMQAQNAIQLNLQHVLNGAPLQFQSSVDVFGTNLEFDRLQYYVSDFVITHDGGQETALSDVFLLVDASEGASIHPLGEWDINAVEAMAFSIGVDEAYNHLDPTLYAAGHPLAPQSPNMHWGWASGYKFAALEGTPEGNSTFEIHALGDDNFFQQSHAFSEEAVDGTVNLFMRAKCESMFIQIDVSGGLIEHSTVDEAATLLTNLRDFVFEPLQGSVGIAQTGGATCSLFPNPSTGRVQLDWGVEAVGTTYALLDPSGRVCRSGTVTQSTDVWNTSDLLPGLYLLVGRGPVLFQQRLIIQ
ncbi:MAG: hypothetical protein OSA78_00080 [Flavobacteriales bacterium]|nr:hypothetical protein [Flavobacteriales bacterium]